MLWYIFPTGSHPAFGVAPWHFSPTGVAGIYGSSLSRHFTGNETIGWFASGSISSSSQIVLQNVYLIYKHLGK